jgi:hypothetical protein
MHPVFAKTFGGLSPRYYFRQFAFGLLVPAFVYLMQSKSAHAMSIGMVVMLLVNTLLYPYSRFVYERVVGFVMGENVFFVNAFLMLVTKAITMALCWTFAVFIAPLGLSYLYFHHSNAEQ